MYLEFVADNFLPELTFQEKIGVYRSNFMVNIIVKNGDTKKCADIYIFIHWKLKHVYKYDS